MIYLWAPANNMSLNGDKFDYHRIGIKPGLEKACCRNPMGDPIIEKDHIKDLGVYISSNLSWGKQIEEVVSKTISMSGWAHRTFRTREPEPMKTVWNSLVRPSLDYCSPLWAPCPSNYGEIDMLEDTQRSFTRNINDMEGLYYAQRPKKLKIYSIQRRHERYKILYV